MEAETSAQRLAALARGVEDERGPRYAALANRLRLLVGDGRLPVGTRLPAERDLAAALQVSRATVTAAYARLRADGWARARQGAGTWTALPAARSRTGGAWAPEPATEGVLDLVHAAPAAPPQVPAAFAAALDELPRLLPGHGYHPAGLPELRARIADRYCARGVPTVAEQVLVTAGSLHGISLVLDVLLRRGQRLLVEHPTYPNVLDAAAARGLRLVPVAVPSEDAAGFVAAAVRTAADLGGPLAYLMPDFQNPTGQLLDDELRARLAAGLRRAGTTAVVDETLVDLALDGKTPAPQASFAPAATVTVGTLSKVAWGGLRVGWVRAERELLDRLTTRAVRESLSGPALEQLAACHLLDAFPELVPARRAALRASRDALRAALAAALPDWQVPRPPGGLVLWCRLPAARSSAVVAAAAPLGLQLAAGPRFGTGHAFDDRLRLPYTAAPEVLTAAVGLLAAADAAAAGARPRAAGARTDPVI